MRFSSVSVAALSLNYDIWFVHGGKNPIGSYEVLQAGDGTETLPYGKVETLKPFSGKIFIESSSDTFLSGAEKKEVTVELFAGVEDGSPCVTGDKIVPFEGTDGNAIRTDYSAASSSSYLPSKKNGMIGTSTFSIDDIRDPRLPSQTFTTSDGVNGLIKLCVRTSIKNLAGLDYVSFVDSYVEVDVDFTASFENFDQTISIAGTTGKELADDRSMIIDVESFVCGDSGINDGMPYDSNYKIGQEFKVCVRPVEEYRTIYKVIGFKDVVCGEADAEQQLVNQNGEGNDLIEIFVGAEVAGSKDSSGENEMGLSAAAFRSVLVAPYFGENPSTDSFFSCSGKVELGSFSPPPPAVDSFNEFLGHDAFGNDLKEVEDTNREGAANACLELPECVGFTEYLGRFYLKSSIIMEWKESADWGATYIKKDYKYALNNFKFLPHQDFYGNDLVDAELTKLRNEGVDIQRAAEACMELDNCVAFNNNLWFKDSVPPKSVEDFVDGGTYVKNDNHDGRHLTAEFSYSGGIVSSEEMSRGLQEDSSEELGNSPFATTIRLSIEDLNGGSLSSPASTVEWSRKVGIGVAAVGSVVALL
ncbi:unnamed protein product [Pseudo-nitzschia multistriata]|uniref:Uncharacterized protein n=1 Tax=Pseudo-nitzschia multistriata TaxID=183589 RepID=A0A448ZNK5_9STRA|nr:unnamed protein product [Pseudo-nitzschia multistriata]